MLAPDVARVLPADENGIAEALTELRAERPVAFPTETVYGLGADAASERAVARVFELKGRPRDHPLIVHLGSAAWLSTYADLADERLKARAEALAAAFWPGPLTLVLPASSVVPRAVTGGQSTVAVRVPAHPVALRLLTEFGRALVAPSANRFGRISPTEASHVAGEFAGTLVVLDGGDCRVGIESTIVDLTSEVPQVLRPGAVSVDKVSEVLGERVATTVGSRGGSSARRRDGSTVRVPGTLARHYAPATRTTLVPAARLAEASRESGVAVLAAGADVPSGFSGRWISLPCDPEAYAHGLYAALRELDEAGATEILVSEVPDEPAWEAIRDRLSRATSAADEREMIRTAEDAR
ncbi:MAG: threonylcarbamoyl-AMP synthase [Trueperaceae bacterium]|nr:threonylcarbamoyl-AMP synthase [Trueperaceae bacterium]